MAHSSRGTVIAAIAALGAVNALLWLLLIHAVGVVAGATPTASVQYTIAATTGLMLPMAAAWTWHARP